MRGKIIFSSMLLLMTGFNGAAQISEYNFCKGVLVHDDQNTYCDAYVKGYEAAQVSGTNSSGTSTQTKPREIVVLSPGNSGTQGKKSLDDMVINLEPGFLERYANGDTDWATVTDINVQDVERTVTLGQEGLDNRTLSFQKKTNLTDYAAKTNNRALLKQIEKDLSEYDTNKAYTIMVARPKE